MLKLKFRLLKDNINLYFIMIAMSLLLAGVFSNTFNGENKTKLIVVDESSSVETLELINQFENSGSFEIELANFEKGLEMIRTRKALILIRINRGVQIYELTPSVESYQVEELIKNSTKERIDRENFTKKVYRILNLKLEENINYNDIEKEINTLMNEHLKNKNIFNIKSSVFNIDPLSNYDPKIHYVIGMTLFFVTYSLMFTVGDYLEDRRLHTLDRMIVSPVSRLSIFLGNIIPAFCIGSFQVSLMILAGKFIFGIKWGNQVLMIILIFISYIFAMTSMSFFIVSRVKTMGQLGSISPIILTGMAMIGGCMWPLEIISSKFMLFLANLTPHKWAMDGIKTLMIKGHITGDTFLTLGVLIFMGIVFLVGGSKIGEKVG